MFYDGDLQSGIALAVQQSKAVLCFVYDETEKSAEWQAILEDDKLQQSIAVNAIAFRLKSGSQEAGFLGGICPVNSTPAVVVIKDARLQTNLQSDRVQATDLESRLLSSFGIRSDSDQTASEHLPVETTNEHVESHTPPLTDSIRYIRLEPSSGRMRLPNNAYDSLRSETEKMLKDDTPHPRIFDTQLNMLRKIPTFRADVNRLQEESGRVELRLSDSTIDRLLRMPAAALRIQSKSAVVGGEGSAQTPAETTPSSNTTAPTLADHAAPTTQQRSSPPTPSVDTNHQPPRMPSNTADDGQESQRIDYMKMQREREQAQKGERERIKAQIKADREERRHNDQLRKQVEADSGTHESTASKKPKSTEIRIQVRTFDGSTLRQSFPPTSTLGKEVRSWIDSSTESNLPYNLKLILTPLPNRNIEAAEEDQTLSDVGLKGSATLVMVPVKGYVESYTGSTPGGLVGSALSGGYNLVSGTTGMLYSGIRSVLGYGETQTTSVGDADHDSGAPATQRIAKVRTLADQRAEDARKDQQFYNGNQLNFEPNKDDENLRKDD